MFLTFFITDLKYCVIFCNDTIGKDILNITLQSNLLGFKGGYTIVILTFELLDGFNLLFFCKERIRTFNL